MSCWGDSWGVSWGDSWGATMPPVQAPTDLFGGGGAAPREHAAVRALAAERKARIRATNHILLAALFAVAQADEGE